MSGKPSSSAAEHPTSLARFVIGTAGHVDHGKSTLVRRLTGIDPDRLAEEKSRQMTIDLGFAWLDLPSGQRVGMVDVPGHERFVRNMLAGVGGIDAALLVIAADEGPMPQTREHLAILDLLGVDEALIVLTKSDLVEPDWLAIVEDEVRELVAETSIDGSTIVPVSATTGLGIGALIRQIEELVSRSDRRLGSGPPRLPIDRVFSVQGFGTVVTGTVIGGVFSVGEDVVLMPSGRSARIRGIQAHGDQKSSVESGVRAAINLTGIEKDDIDRGDTLTVSGALEASLRIDGRVRLMKTASMVLQQNSEIDFFAGSAEAPAKVTLLDRDELGPGDEGWVQFRLARPMAVMKGDRFILRRLSPSETIGGGAVVDPAPNRHKRFRDDVVSSLETRASGTPEELILAQTKKGAIAKSALFKALGNDHAMATLDQSVADLLQTGNLIRLTESADPTRELLIAREGWNQLSQQFEGALAAFHQSNPMRAGMPREELRRRSGLDQRLFDALLGYGAGQNQWVDDGALVRLPAFSITLRPADRQLADRYLAEVRSGRFSPPAPASASISPDLLTALTESGELVRVGDGVFYDPDVLAEIERSVIDHLDQHESISLAEFRDRFDTSRKYAQAVLEYFDRVRVTRRVGDVRRRYPRGAG